MRKLAKEMEKELKQLYAKVKDKYTSVLHFWAENHDKFNDKWVKKGLRAVLKCDDGVFSIIDEERAKEIYVFKLEEVR